MLYTCEVCGRVTERGHKTWGYTLCSKHMHQYLKYKRFLDNNPRTQQDLNDYRIEGNIAIFDLYNHDMIKDAEFIIDADDVELVRPYKWRRTTYDTIVTGNCTKTNPTIHLYWLILGIAFNHDGLVVDHINCNRFDNRKCNLRITTQQMNVCNKSYMSKNTSGIIGVWFDKEKNKWCAEIRFKKIKTFIGYYEDYNEAAYARYIAELLLFGEFQNLQNKYQKAVMSKNIPYTRKMEIANYVSNRICEKTSVHVITHYPRV